MRNRSALIAAVVGAAVLALVVVFALSPAGGQKDITSPIVGTVAPPINGANLHGGQVDLDSFKGEWVLVNFFATWCPPCVQEHPELVKLSKDDGGPVQVLSVSFQDSSEKVWRFFKDNGGKWPVVTNDTGRIGVDYGVKGLPESFLISPYGQVVVKFEGGITAKDIRGYVAKLEAQSEGGGS